MIVLPQGMNFEATMLTIHPLDRTREIKPVRVPMVHRVPTHRLALVVSAVAAVVAGVLQSATAIADGSIVLGTVSVAFALSWINSALPSRR
ncbi:MAG: hypothetical protein RIS41_1447 [Actinomycetota bacterium]|jgi:hypothetical protein